MAAFKIAPDANETYSPRQHVNPAEHRAIRSTPLAGIVLVSTSSSIRNAPKQLPKFKSERMIVVGTRRVP